MNLSVVAPTPVAPLVLVVDDDLDARTIYRGSLEHLGFRTMVRENGQEAIEATRRYRPDAVALDISMPVLDGLRAARRIKEDPALRDTFIVLMTAFGDDRHSEAMEIGCDAFLCKPFNPLVFGEILGGLRTFAASDIIKRCACGRAYTLATWSDLPLCGTIESVELRNCAGCGSSLALTNDDSSIRRSFIGD